LCPEQETNAESEKEIKKNRTNSVNREGSEKEKGEIHWNERDKTKKRL
jgi:hypothetical protein